MPRSARSFAEAEAELDKAGVIGKTLTNEKFGLSGVVSGKSLRKMRSGKALGKSVLAAAHVHAIANVDALFARATLHREEAHIPEDKNIKCVHRFGVLMEFNGEYIPVKITVKESANPGNNNKIYTIEVVNIATLKRTKSAGHSTSADASLETSSYVPFTDFERSLADLPNAVKP
ncbi:MAG: hypothetical protein LBR38_04335 [Synergistaceae bacterium]|jgi:hypothetical protein|nr:hypothetical protein [Synergistaceae bacterium]